MAKKKKANPSNYRLLAAVSSLFLIIFYVTGCGREAKITLTDNYKPTPINLAKPETSERLSPNGGFSTDLTKAEASFQVSPIDDPSVRSAVNFTTADVLECSVKPKAGNLIEVSLRFSNAAVGSVGMNYTSETEAGSTKIQYFDSTEVKRVAYQDAKRRNFTAANEKTICGFKTAIVGKEVRAFMDCSLRGATENIHLSGSVSCHLLGAN